MKHIFTFALLASSLSIFAQDVNLSKNQLNANLIPLSLSYEGKIDDNKSFTLGGGINGTGTTVDDEPYFFVAPAFSASVRNYYTRKRVKKDNLQNNSGNYVGIYYLSIGAFWKC